MSCGCLDENDIQCWIQESVLANTMMLKSLFGTVQIKYITMTYQYEVRYHLKE